MAQFDELEWKIIATDEATVTLEKVSKGLKDVSSASKESSGAVGASASSWKSIAGGVLAGGVALGVAKEALGAVKNVIMGSIQEAAEYQRNQAQLAAAITSTGGAAGVTLGELNSMASKLSDLTAIDDDVINSVQAMQLTFTNITKETFPQVTAAALDMATAMNGGATPSADQLRAQMVQLGKALNNPKEGVSALTKVGVNLTEQQKEQITTMLKHNDVIGAQNVVLAELSKEFGGSAAAAANTFDGRMNRLSNTVGDVKKSIGQALMPTLFMFMDTTTDASGKIIMNQDTMEKWQLRIYQVGVILKGVIGTIFNFGKGLIDVAKVIFEFGKLQITVYSDIGKALMNFGEIAKDIFKAIKQAMTGDFGGALDTLKASFKSTFSGSLGAFNDFKSATVSAVSGMEHSFDPLADAISEATNPVKFRAMQQSMKDAEEATKKFAGGAKPPVVDLGDAHKEAANKAKAAADKIKDAMQKVGEDYKSATETASNALAALETSHAEATLEIGGKIKDLQDQLKELKTTYEDTMKGLNASEADRVVSQEDKVKKLKDDIAMEKQGMATNEVENAQKLLDLREQMEILRLKQNEQKPDADSSSRQSLLNQIADNQKKQDDLKAGKGSGTPRLDELNESLAKEEAALKAYYAKKTGLETEIAEARRRANLTDFQRDMEDLAARRTQAQQDYDVKNKQLQDSLIAQQTALERETVIFNAKKQVYLDVQAQFQQFNDSYKKNLEDMNAATQKNVDAMNVKLKQLQAIVAAIESAKSKAGIAGVVGIPGQSESAPSPSAPAVSPAGSNVTINLGGVTVASQADEDRLVARLVRELQLSTVGSQ